MTWSAEVEAGEWLVRRLHPFEAHDVGSIIPEGFAAYCRILHPASRYVDGERVPVRWAEVAAWSGGELHPLVQFPSLSRHPQSAAPPPWDEEPWAGSLTAEQVGVLVEDLAGYTTTSERCWFAVWDGRGDLYQTVPLVPAGSDRVVLPGILPPELHDGPRLRTAEREYVLYTGPIEAAAALGAAPDGEGPNLWWPEDRAWCVATDIDLPWTFVGGSQALVDHLCADDQLEAFPVEISDPITLDSDIVNG